MILKIRIGIESFPSPVLLRKLRSMPSITSINTQDVRFPTSLELDGSDAVNVDPDYSAAYVTVTLDNGEQGHAFVFTCGRGNDIVTHAIDAYGTLLVGRDADAL